MKKKNTSVFGIPFVAYENYRHNNDHKCVHYAYNRQQAHVNHELTEQCTNSDDKGTF